MDKTHYFICPKHNFLTPNIEEYLHHLMEYRDVAVLLGEHEHDLKIEYDELSHTSIYRCVTCGQGYTMTGLAL